MILIFILIIVVSFKTEMYTVDCVIELSPTIPNIAQGGFERYMYLPIILLITPVVLIPEGDEMPFLTFETRFCFLQSRASRRDRDLFN